MCSTRYSCQIFMKLEFSQQIPKKSSNNTFHENLSNGSRGLLWGQLDRQTDMTTLIVAFRNFANAPNN